MSLVEWVCVTVELNLTILIAILRVAILLPHSRFYTISILIFDYLAASAIELLPQQGLGPREWSDSLWIFCSQSYLAFVRDWLPDSEPVISKLHDINSNHYTLRIPFTHINELWNSTAGSLIWNSHGNPKLVGIITCFVIEIGYRFLTSHLLKWKDCPSSLCLWAQKSSSYFL